MRNDGHPDCLLTAARLIAQAIGESVRAITAAVTPVLPLLDSTDHVEARLALAEIASIPRPACPELVEWVGPRAKLPRRRALPPQRLTSTCRRRAWMPMPARAVRALRCNASAPR